MGNQTILTSIVWTLDEKYCGSQWCPTAYQHSLKYPLLCSTEQRNLYRFGIGTTCGRV